MTEIKPTITYDDFVKMDLRVAKVLEVRDHPNADKLLCLTIDLGTERREIIGGLKEHCTAESLVGKDVVVLVNIQPRKMRGLDSNGMLLAASYEQDGARKVVVLTTANPVPAGSTIS
jgi:methionyl-tRNA synthetase